MTFEEYWAEVVKLKALPNTAIKQIPGSLSKNTKKRLIKKRPEETVEILRSAIDEVDHGSVEIIDSLVRKRL